MTQTHYTVGDLAALYGVPVHSVRRTIDARLASIISRIGTYRVVRSADLPLIEAVLRHARLPR